MHFVTFGVIERLLVKVTNNSTKAEILEASEKDNLLTKGEVDFLTRKFNIVKLVKK